MGVLLSLFSDAESERRPLAFEQLIKSLCAARGFYRASSASLLFLTCCPPTHTHKHTGSRRGNKKSGSKQMFISCLTQTDKGQIKVKQEQQENREFWENKAPAEHLFRTIPIQDQELVEDRCEPDSPNNFLSVQTWPLQTAAG